MKESGKKNKCVLRSKPLEAKNDNLLLKIVVFLELLFFPVAEF